MKKVVSTATGVPPGYFLDESREMQSSHRAALGDPADRLLMPKSNSRTGTGRKDGPGKFHQRPCCPAASEARSPLTVREIEVIRYLSKSLLYKEIADRMSMSFSIVHKLQHKIFVTLHVSN